MAQFSLRMECADLGLRACVCEEAGDLPLQTGEEMGRCLHSSLYFETLFIECGSGFLTAENGAPQYLDSVDSPCSPSHIACSDTAPDPSAT